MLQLIKIHLNAYVKGVHIAFWSMIMPAVFFIIFSYNNPERLPVFISYSMLLVYGFDLTIRTMGARDEGFLRSCVQTKSALLRYMLSSYVASTVFIVASISVLTVVAAITTFTISGRVDVFLLFMYFAVSIILSFLLACFMLNFFYIKRHYKDFHNIVIMVVLLLVLLSSFDDVHLVHVMNYFNIAHMNFAVVDSLLKGELGLSFMYIITNSVFAITGLYSLLNTNFNIAHRNLGDL